MPFIIMNMNLHTLLLFNRTIVLPLLFSLLEKRRWSLPCEPLEFCLKLPLLPLDLVEGDLWHAEHHTDNYAQTAGGASHRWLLAVALLEAR